MNHVIELVFRISNSRAYTIRVGEWNQNAYAYEEVLIVRIYLIITFRKLSTAKSTAGNNSLMRTISQYILYVSYTQQESNAL